MFIKRMVVGNFRQMHDVEFGPFREPSDRGELIVLAGPNGSGKSSALELLSFGLANRYSWQYYQGRKITEHRFAIQIGLSDSELTALEEEYKDDPAVDYGQKY